MNSCNTVDRSCCEFGHHQESRTPRFNLPIQHPSKWQLIRELLFSSPNHIHRYRQLSTRMFENTIRTLNRGDCQ